MKNIHCQRILNIETVSSAFKSDHGDLSSKVISCFYSCYRMLFLKWAQITYQQYPADLIEFVASNSFADGILKLKESAARSQLYQGNASIKTILFHYCKNMLLGNLAKENRQAAKNERLFAVLSAQTDSGDDSNAEHGYKEEQYRKLMWALDRMEAADRQIIHWRHIEEKSNDEIAGLLAITVPSATNRIYRVMQRLRELTEKAKGLS